MITDSRMRRNAATIYRAATAIRVLLRRFDALVTGRGEVAVACVLALLCLAPAVRASHGFVRGLTQPYDLDQFRDTATAQSMLDGRFPADPDYLGETLWYNPMPAAIVAALSRVSGREVATVQVQFGPFLNGGVMLAFFAMAVVLTGPWIALAALSILLYAPSSGDPAWATPAYSPWLFTPMLTAGFFYMSVALFVAAFRRDTPRWWALAGAGLGFTFLGHTGAALVLGLAMLPGLVGRDLYVAGASRCQPSSCSAALRVSLVIGFALLCSSPFLWSIVGHYHLHIVHRAPMNWDWPALANPWTVARGSVNVRNGLAVIGASLVAWRARGDVAARLLWAWYVSAGLLLLYGFGAFGRWPKVIPQYHFFFYLRAAGALFAAVGVWGLVEGVARSAARALRLSPRRRSQVAIAAVAIGAVAVSRAAGNVVRDRGDLANQRALAVRYTMEMTESDVRARLRAQTPPSAVVFTSEEEGLRVVAPSGRSVVVVPAPFSNPYVPLAPREAAQSALRAALFAGDAQRFAAVAHANGVTHVLLSVGDASAVTARFPELVEISRRDPYVLYRLR
jgi:hypothetical protein